MPPAAGEGGLDRRPVVVAGKSMRTLVPCPGELVRSRTPPDCCTKPWTMARPRPLPLPAGFVVKKGSVARMRIRQAASLTVSFF